MAASSASVVSHHAADISSATTTVALVSYNVEIPNTEVTGQGWAKPGGKQLKLKSDVENIFKNRHGIHIALFSAVGNMLVRLSHSTGDSHPTAQEMFEGILADLNLTHIQVKAHEPYVALIDTTWWRPITCKLIGNLGDIRDLVVPQLILQHLDTKASMLCFNAHIPTSMETPTTTRTCIIKMCSLATEDNSSLVLQPTASMPWLTTADLNITKHTMLQ